MTKELMSQLTAEANAGARFPVVRPISFGSLTVATHVFTITAEQEGKIRAIHAFATFPNTCTIQVEIDGTSVLVGGTADSLTTVTDYDVVFDPAADLEYGVGSVIEITLVVGTGAATSGLVEITSDERQPVVV